MINAELLKRNTEEIVTAEELEDLIKRKTPVTYCGYEVSGPVHIGTLIAVNKQIDFLRAGCEVKVLLADVHTRLNRKGNEDWIDRMVEYWKHCFIGFGLKADFVLGSEFQFEEDYVKDVLELGLHSTLNRALRSMQDIARDIENAHVSQIIYPLMQIADIKALGVDIAHGGMEQRKIHMLARETLSFIGHQKPVCIHTPLLCSLQGPETKMSSSKPETMIAVDENPESIRKKIQNAYCPLSSEGNPILGICKYLLFTRLNELEIKRPEKFGGSLRYTSYQELENNYLNNKLHPADLKNTVSEALISILEPVREHLKKEGISYEKPE